MKDAEIVALYWERNEAAIQQTQQKYGAYLLKVAYNILSDFEDSRECVNDTYLKAWNSMPTHRPSVLSTYLGKIARQLSIDVFRKKTVPSAMLPSMLFLWKSWVTVFLTAPRRSRLLMPRCWMMPSTVSFAHFPMMHATPSLAGTISSIR